MAKAGEVQKIGPQPTGGASFNPPFIPQLGGSFEAIQQTLAEMARAKRQRQQMADEEAAKSRLMNQEYSLRGKEQERGQTYAKDLIDKNAQVARDSLKYELEQKSQIGQLQRLQQQAQSAGMIPPGGTIADAVTAMTDLHTQTMDQLMSAQTKAEIRSAKERLADAETTRNRIGLAEALGDATRNLTMAHLGSASAEAKMAILQQIDKKGQDAKVRADNFRNITQLQTAAGINEVAGTLNALVNKGIQDEAATAQPVGGSVGVERQNSFELPGFPAPPKEVLAKFGVGGQATSQPSRVPYSQKIQSPETFRMLVQQSMFAGLDPQLQKIGNIVVDAAMTGRTTEDLAAEAKKAGLDMLTGDPLAVLHARVSGTLQGIRKSRSTMNADFSGALKPTDDPAGDKARMEAAQKVPQIPAINDPAVETTVLNHLAKMESFLRPAVAASKRDTARDLALAGAAQKAATFSTSPDELYNNTFGLGVRESLARVAMRMESLGLTEGPEIDKFWNSLPPEFSKQLRMEAASVGDALRTSSYANFLRDEATRAVGDYASKQADAARTALNTEPSEAAIQEQMNLLETSDISEQTQAGRQRGTPASQPAAQAADAATAPIPVAQSKIWRPDLTALDAQLKGLSPEMQDAAASIRSDMYPTTMLDALSFSFVEDPVLNGVEKYALPNVLSIFPNQSSVFRQHNWPKSEAAQSLKTQIGPTASPPPALPQMPQQPQPQPQAQPNQPQRQAQPQQPSQPQMPQQQPQPATAPAGPPVGMGQTQPQFGGPPANPFGEQAFFA